MEPQLRHEKNLALGIIGESVAAYEIRDFIARAANITDAVLLRGETGTGKDLVAALIHKVQNSKAPFVPVDCGLIPEQLFESELFGHTRQAFTSAQYDKMGLIQEADGGTLFLNEIGDMPLSFQAKFLRLTEGKSFRRIGETKDKIPNVRIIAGTNVDLEDAVRSKRMRSDLFYRLNGISLTVPPLRDRMEDVPLLAQHFLEQRNPGKRFSEEALAEMANYSWPGNVRELEFAVKKADFKSREAGLIAKEDLPVLDDRVILATTQTSMIFWPSPLPTSDDVLRDLYKEALRRTRGNMVHTARMVGLEPNTLYARLKSLEISEEIELARKKSK